MHAFVAVLDAATLAVATGLSIWQFGENKTIVEGALRVDDLALVARLRLLRRGRADVVLSLPRAARRRGARRRVLHAAALERARAWWCSPSADNLVTLFLGIEVLSIPLYVMCAGRLHEPARSLESGLKYLVIGSVGSATLLYGLAFVYGATGSTDFPGIARRIARRASLGDPLLLVGIALSLSGLAFKASVAPFHQWTPDVYQGAPTPVTAFMAVATKAAAFAILLRFFDTALLPAADDWDIAMAVLAVDLDRGRQHRRDRPGLAEADARLVRVAQAGYMLAGVVVASELGVKSVVFYLFVYLFMNVAAFAVVIARERETALGDDIAPIAGIGAERPLLAWPITISMLALAGLPGTAGFIGKFFLIEATVEGDFTWLGVAIVIGTMVSLVVLPARDRGDLDAARGGRCRRRSRARDRRRLLAPKSCADAAAARSRRRAALQASPPVEVVAVAVARRRRGSSSSASCPSPLLDLASNAGRRSVWALSESRRPKRTSRSSVRSGRPDRRAQARARRALGGRARGARPRRRAHAERADRRRQGGRGRRSVDRPDAGPHVRARRARRASRRSRPTPPASNLLELGGQAAPLYRDDPAPRHRTCCSTSARAQRRLDRHGARRAGRGPLGGAARHATGMGRRCAPGSSATCAPGRARTLIELVCSIAWGAPPERALAAHVLFYLSSAAASTRLVDTEGGAQQDRFVGRLTASRALARRAARRSDAGSRRRCGGSSRARPRCASTPTGCRRARAAGDRRSAAEPRRPDRLRAAPAGRTATSSPSRCRRADDQVPGGLRVAVLARRRAERRGRLRPRSGRRDRVRQLAAATESAGRPRGFHRSGRPARELGDAHPKSEGGRDRGLRAPVRRARGGAAPVHRAKLGAEEWTRGCPVCRFGRAAGPPGARGSGGRSSRIHWAGTETATGLERLHGGRGPVGRSVPRARSRRRSKAHRGLTRSFGSATAFRGRRAPAMRRAAEAERRFECAARARRAQSR